MTGSSGTVPLNVFDVHAGVIRDYAEYIDSFVNIADDRIRAKVKESLSGGCLWPTPLLQFNPAYQVAASAEKWATEDGVHPDISVILSDYSLFKHQLDALRLGVEKKDFIVTSGTGSGKSLTYMGSIFNHLLQNPQPKGVQAVVIYPTNALINSQTNEINTYAENYAGSKGEKFPIRYRQYTGQEKEVERQEIMKDLPHILLTNYMMLELILTRPQESKLKEAIYENLRFLVLDELHTYRGRQGADVSMLVRRVRTQCKNEVCCIGTSATMASVGGASEKSEIVASVAGKLFGREFDADQVIDETLTRSLGSDSGRPTAGQLRQAIEGQIDLDASPTTLRQHPVAIWLENCIALDERESRLVRGRPKDIKAIATDLANDSGVDVEICQEHLVALLSWINKVNRGKNSGGGGGPASPLAPVHLPNGVGIRHTRPR